LKDVEDGMIAYGNPAKEISQNTSKRYLQEVKRIEDEDTNTRK